MTVSLKVHASGALTPKYTPKGGGGVPSQLLQLGEHLENTSRSISCFYKQPVPLARISGADCPDYWCSMRGIFNIKSI